MPEYIPSPEEIGDWLSCNGWAYRSVRTIGGAPWRIFVGFQGVQPVELEVPQRVTAPDYARCVRVLLGDVADLQGGTLDEVRLSVLKHAFAQIKDRLAALEYRDPNAIVATDKGGYATRRAINAARNPRLDFERRDG